MLVEPCVQQGEGASEHMGGRSSLDSSSLTLRFTRHMQSFLKKRRFLNSTVSELIQQAWDGPRDLDFISLTR